MYFVRYEFHHNIHEQLLCKSLSTYYVGQAISDDLNDYLTR
jgi:hypothetical protein